MKYEIKTTTTFDKNLKKIVKRGYNLDLLKSVVGKIANGEKLPDKNRDHILTGNYKGYRECHITPDWLLIYKINEEQLILYLTKTGTHSDLF